MSTKYRTYEKRLSSMREWARKNPAANNAATKKWAENNPIKVGIIKRTSYREVRKKILALWGPLCLVCGRELTVTGSLRSICHHISYDPEKVVVVCNQCHTLIHNRKSYKHPFYMYSFADEAPFLMALAVLEMLDRYVVVKHNGIKHENGRFVNTTEVYLEVVEDEKEKQG